MGNTRGYKKQRANQKKEGEKEKRKKLEIIVKKPTYGVRLTIKEGAKERAKKERREEHRIRKGVKREERGKRRNKQEKVEEGGKEYSLT